MDDGDAAFPRRRQFFVRTADSRGNNNRFGIFQVIRTVSDMDTRALFT